MALGFAVLDFHSRPRRRPSCVTTFEENKPNAIAADPPGEVGEVVKLGEAIVGNTSAHPLSELAYGIGLRPSIEIDAMVSFSSTAVVLRILM